MRTTPRGNEQLVAARTGTRRFFRSIRWALTLALRLGGFLGSSLLRLPLLADPLAIPATLLTATLAPTFRLPPCLAGPPMPPPIRCPLTCRTAIPRLRPPRLKELLAAFQQTAPPPRRLTGALPRRRSSITMKLTQGSAYSRKVKSRRGASTPFRDALYLLPYPSASLPSSLITTASGRHFPTGWPPPTTAGHTPRLPAKWFNSRPPLTYQELVEGQAPLTTRPQFH